MNSPRYIRSRINVIGSLGMVIFTALSVSGCAYGTRMALDANKGNVLKLEKPIAIFTLRTQNTYKPSYQPEVNRIEFVSSTAKDKKTFQPAKPYKQAKDEYLEYLVSVDLSPGAYTVRDIKGTASTFLVSGHFSFPINTHFNLPSGVTYLGHITMVNRQRMENEERSGGPLPLIDQAVTGFSGGTFDVTVSDRGETDIPDFLEAYPALKDVTIAKEIMQK
jgi:hypothetical protein